MNTWKLVTVAALTTLTAACSSDSDSDPAATGGAGAGGAATGGAATGGAATGGAAGGGSGGTITGGVGGGGSGGTQAGGAGGSQESCTPEPVPNFVPEWIPPQPLYQGVCSDSEIAAITAGCFGSTATTAACFQAQEANPTCTACAVTPETASAYGATINYGNTRGFNDRNFFGCYAHAEGDLTDAGCGAKIKAASNCAVESCGSCLPVTDTDDLADFNVCTQAALAGECLSYSQAAQTCGAALSGPLADQCPWGSETAEELMGRYMVLFCSDDPNG